MDLPDDLDRFLAESEGRVVDLIPGTEKKIIRADSVSRARTPFAVVYVHGFSATRQETVPLADRVAARLGANLFYTRLTGHGSTGTALAQATLEQWQADVGEAMAIGRRLGESMILMGVSTGAALILQAVALAPSPDIHAMVLMSPNFLPRNRLARLLLWPFGWTIVRLLHGPTYKMKTINELQARYWTTKYPSIAALDLMKLVKDVRNVRYEDIVTPTLVLYSRNDRIVDPEETEKYFAKLGATHKQLIEITNAEDPKQHVLAGDILSPGATDPVCEKILAFLDAAP